MRRRRRPKYIKTLRLERQIIVRARKRRIVPDCDDPAETGRGCYATNAGNDGIKNMV